MADFNLPTPATFFTLVGYSYANRFTCTFDTTCEGVMWYRDGTTPMPTKIHLTRVGDSSSMVTLGPTPWTWTDLGGGWYATSWPNVQLIEANTPYVIVAYMESVGSKHGYGVSTVTPDVPLVRGLGAVRAGDLIDPATNQAANTWLAISPIVSGTAPAGGVLDPIDYQVIQQDIREYLLSGYANLNPQSLAKLTYDALLALRTVVDNAKAWTDALGPWPSLLTNTWLTATHNFLTDQATWLAKADTQLTGASGGGGSAFYGPTGIQVAAGVETLLAGQGVPPDMSLLREHLTLSPDLTDTTRWTSSGTMSAAGDGFADFGADVYLVTFGTIPTNQPQHALPGSQVWTPRLSWCAPLRNGMALERRFLDFQDNLVTADGLYMGGLLVYAGPGVAYTVDGLVLDRP